MHDYLNQPGGAERVVLALAQMWPTAPIYTSLYRPESTFPEFGDRDVRTSPLHRLPVDHSFRNLLPFYPAAFRSFGTLSHDVVISSSSGWAHGVRTAPSTFHAVYCHAPARWLYTGEYMRAPRRQRALGPVLGGLRAWDRAAALRADLYIANSRDVRRRIRRHYGIDAPVVHPPVDVERFRPRERGERFLVVSRLLPYKRVDAIVDVATRVGLGLDVVGTGPALDELRHRAGPTVEFHGRIPDREVTEMLEGCRALCLPGREDFGITAVEAGAAGKPVIALAAGGALETVEDGVTGTFFMDHQPDEVLAAIERCERITSSPEEIAATARRFSPAAFEARLRTLLEAALAAHRERQLGATARSAAAPLALRAPAPAARSTNGSANGTAEVASAIPRTLMLGKGWFPNELGGLDRYYRDLFERLPGAHGVVVGAGSAVPTSVAGVSDHRAQLPRRLLSFWLATQRAAADAEVVDAHFALYALASLWLGRLRSKPVVVHFHGPWADESSAAGDGSRARRAVRRWLERAAYRRADEALVLTSAFRQILVERYGVAPWIINVEPPGVDLERFTPGCIEHARAQLGLPSEAFVAVAVRRLVPRMGLEVLVQAWGEAVPSLPRGSALLLVGDGPLRTGLEAVVADQGLSGSVRLLGRVGEDRLLDVYRAADLAVVPSLEHEGFGLVVLEAAACGTPSLVTAAGGLPEAVAGLDTTLIVPPGDPQALRERLLRARVDRPSREATRAHAERFDWSQVAERHGAILRRVAAAPTRSRIPAPARRLKVVYIDHVARLSGGEIALLRLLPHLDRVQPHVVLAEDGPLVGALHLAGISTEVLPLATTARQLRKGEVGPRTISPAVAGATASYVLRLAARLRQLRPDLVHTNSLKAGVYGSLAAQLAGIPMVWHVRDRIAEDYLPLPAVALVRNMSRHLANAVVANSYATMATLGAREKPVVIYSVLPEVMSDAPVRHRATGGPLAFGMVGRLAPWKGQDLFLRAFAQAFPDGDERAVVVGGALFGEDDYARGLESLPRDFGIADRVDFRGQRPDVWHELSRFDVLVHASITPEPFGQVILEAMAAGVPVIAAGAGGPAEILSHDVTGLLYEPADRDSLAHAMRRMRDRELRDRLSDAARRGLGPYAPGVVAAELQRLYETVAARARR